MLRHFIQLSLTNGLRIAAYHFPGSYTTYIGFWIRSGYWDESSDVNGISHFVEHLLSSNNQLNDPLLQGDKALGIPFYAFTASEYMAFLAQVPISQTEETLLSMADTLFALAFTKEMIDTQRKVILKEIEQEERNIALANYYQLESALWYGGMPPLTATGSKHTVTNLNLEQIISHYKNVFGSPKNFAIVSVGGIEPKLFIDLVEKRFNSLENRPESVRERQRDRNIDKRPAYVSTVKGGAPTHLLYGFDIVDVEEPVQYAVNVLGYYLDYQLRREIREHRGLAYNMKSFAHFFSDRGLLNIAVVCDWQEIESVHAIINEVLTKTVSETLCADVIKWAKKIYLTQTMIRLDELKGVMSWLGKHQLFDICPPTIESIDAGIGSLDSDTMTSLVQSVIHPSNLIISTYSPHPPHFMRKTTFLNQTLSHLDFISSSNDPR